MREPRFKKYALGEFAKAVRVIDNAKKRGEIKQLPTNFVGATILSILGRTTYITETSGDDYVRRRIAEDLLRFYDLVKESDSDSRGRHAPQTAASKPRRATAGKAGATQAGRVFAVGRLSPALCVASEICACAARYLLMAGAILISALPTLVRGADAQRKLSSKLLFRRIDCDSGGINPRKVCRFFRRSPAFCGFCFCGVALGNLFPPFCTPRG